MNMVEKTKEKIDQLEKQLIKQWALLAYYEQEQKVKEALLLLTELYKKTEPTGEFPVRFELKKVEEAPF